MKSRLQLLQEESFRTGLEKNERDSLRQSLIAYIDEHPAPAQQRSLQIFKPAFFSRFSTVGALTLAILMVGTGVAMAANNSLPGELLYPIKVGVNEKARMFVALSEAQKANLEVTFASHRLEEAEKLNIKSELTASAKTSISHEFSQHIKNLGARVNKLAEKKEYSDIAATNARLEASLNAHAGILPALSLVGDDASPTIDSR